MDPLQISEVSSTTGIQEEETINYWENILLQNDEVSSSGIPVEILDFFGTLQEANYWENLGFVCQWPGRPPTPRPEPGDFDYRSSASDSSDYEPINEDDVSEPEIQMMGEESESEIEEEAVYPENYNSSDVEDALYEGYEAASEDNTSDDE